LRRISSEVKRYYDYSMLFPSTFYNVASESVGSRDYRNYLLYYAYLIDLRKRFTKFWVEKVYGDEAPKEVENFVKDSENIFRLTSGGVPRFLGGSLIEVFYIICFLLAGYFVQRRALFGLTKEEVEALGKIDLEYSNGKAVCHVIRGSLFGRFIHSLVTGKLRWLKKFFPEGGVWINGRNILRDKGDYSVCYIPSPEHVPGGFTVARWLRYWSCRGKGDADRLEEVLGRPEIR
ncbi:MAG: hypothetical protein GY940_18800, partial [bacterium]|nr:hypothetical protein [bacterium]